VFTSAVRNAKLEYPHSRLHPPLYHKELDKQTTVLCAHLVLPSSNNIQNVYVTA